MTVLVCGLPGSGKSYFASHLASVLKAEYISSDKVRKELGASGRYSLNDKLVIYTEMISIARRFLKENKSVVIDATFYLDSMRTMFITEAKAWRSDIFFIHVYANESLVKERLNKPRMDSEANYSVYLDIGRQFEKISQPHLELESTQQNITSMLNRAIAYISGLYERERS
jgi:predicted kinase